MIDDKCPCSVWYEVEEEFSDMNVRSTPVMQYTALECHCLCQQSHTDYRKSRQCFKTSSIFLLNTKDTDSKS